MPKPNVRDRLNRETPEQAIRLHIAVPAEQFRNDFVFLAPDKYAFDYVSIIAPVESDVSLMMSPSLMDGSLSETVRNGGSEDFKSAMGYTLINADQPLSVVVYGYDQYVSYGYPGKPT